MVRRIPILALENMSELKSIARCIFVEINDNSMSRPREPISFEPGDKAMIELDAAPGPSDFVLALVPEEQTALFRTPSRSRARRGRLDPRRSRAAQSQFPHHPHLERDAGPDHRRLPQRPSHLRSDRAAPALRLNAANPFANAAFSPQAGRANRRLSIIIVRLEHSARIV